MIKCWAKDGGCGGHADRLLKCETMRSDTGIDPKVEGKPCVNLGTSYGGVYVYRRISGLEIDEGNVNGDCERVDPEDARPDEPTDGMAIGCDCIRLGPGWWEVRCFGSYFVYDPELVARSLAGDYSWELSAPISGGADRDSETSTDTFG